MTRHEWHERIDGDVRFVRVTHHAGRWAFQARLKSETDWTALDPPPLDDLRELRDVLARKYTRGRLPHAQLLAVEALIRSREG